MCAAAVVVAVLAWNVLTAAIGDTFAGMADSIGSVPTEEVASTAGSTSGSTSTSGTATSGGTTTSGTGTSGTTTSSGGGKGTKK